MKLIALVSVLTLVDGVRTEFKPGEEVTGLARVDVEELKSVGAIADEDDVAADKKVAARVEAAGAKEFSAARKAVIAKAAAIEA